MDKMAWESLRTAVIADDTDLTTYEYESATYAARMCVLPPNTQNIAIAIWGKTAADYTAAYKLRGRRRTNGPIEHLASGVITLGSRLITKDPLTKAVVTGYWADTITDTSNGWIKSAIIQNSAHNEICYLCLATFGLNDVELYVDLDGGGGTSITELNAIITGESV